MNDLDQLRTLGHEVPLPDHHDLAPARARLLVALNSPPRARRAWLPRLVGGLSVGLAAAVVAAVVVVVNGGGATNGTAGGAGAPVAGPTAPSLSGPSASSGSAGPSAAGASEVATVLRLAATAALAEPFTEPRADQFLYLETKLGADTRQDWLSLDGTHDGLVAKQGAEPGVLIPGCRDGKRDAVRGNDTVVGTEPCEPTPAYLPDAPTDATAMGEYLVALGGHPGTNSYAKNALYLALHHHLRPAARAALYEAAGLIDGVTVVPDVTDGAGRPGVGIRWSYGGGSTTMVFDPTTYRFLGFEDSEALIAVAIVDAVGQTP